MKNHRFHMYAARTNGRPDICGSGFRIFFLLKMCTLCEIFCTWLVYSSRSTDSSYVIFAPSCHLQINHSIMTFTSPAGRDVFRLSLCFLPPTINFWSINRALSECGEFRHIGARSRVCAISRAHRTSRPEIEKWTSILIAHSQLNVILRFSCRIN